MKQNPVDRTLKNWLPAAAGFIAASAMTVWIRPFPPSARTLEQVLSIYGMSLIDTLLVLSASATAAFLTWFPMQLAHRWRGAAPPPRAIWRISSRAVWLLPLYLFAIAGSPWGVITAVLVILGVVHVLRFLQPHQKQKPALSSGWKIFSCIVAAAAIEAGLVAAGIERARQAIPIVGFAALIVAWHATRGVRPGHPSRGLVTIFLAIVFTCGALVRRVGVARGDSFLGFLIDPAIEASVYALQTSFGGGPVAAFRAEGKERPKPEGDASVNVKGVPHQGIFLWPEVKKEATLVPPLPMLGGRSLKDRKTTLTIPFYGAYWFFRPPFNRPPFGSLVMHGSPAVRSFLSNDGSPLWEEAHQDLQTNLDLSWCKAIELDVRNADHNPLLLEIELLMVDRARLWDKQSLGRKPLRTMPEESALEETLAFPIPAQANVKSVVELIVRFHLLPPRHIESAQVELERFRLVPKPRR